VLSDGRTSQLLFPPAGVAAYISTLTTLDPVTCCSQWQLPGVSLLRSMDQINDPLPAFWAHTPPRSSGALQPEAYVLCS
jgi:hypothetical protein